MILLRRQLRGAATRMLGAYAGLVVLVSAPAAAQEPEPLSTQAAAYEDTRSPVVAGLLQYLSGPLLLGYAYAGDFKRGLVPGAVMLGGLTLAAFNAGAIVEPDAGNGDLLIVGLVVTVAANVYSIFDAGDAALDRNARIAVRGASLELIPTRGGVALTVAVPFR